MWRYTGLWKQVGVFGISGLSGGGSLAVSAVLGWSSWEPEVSRFALING